MDIRPWDDVIGELREIQLVASDIDGTLALPDGSLPPGLDAVLDRLGAVGISFVPASGRQLATLRDMFADFRSVTTFIAENGAVVDCDGEVTVSGVLPDALVARAVGIARSTFAPGARGLVVCTPDAAVVENADPEFVEAARQYYHELRVVVDLTAVRGPVVKLAAFDATGSSRTLAAAFAALNDAAHEVVESGTHWADVMDRNVNKGTALRTIQQHDDHGADHTLAFGDNENDLPLLQAAGWPCAVANAVDTVRGAARILAPANAEHGVVTVLSALLDAESATTPVR